jgi:GT2 family glycosyltransferase
LRRLAIVIVSYNAGADLAGALGSLTTNPPETPHSVVVVDNASSQNIAGMVAKDFRTVEFIPAGSNLGFGRANNLGVRATRSELVLLLNPDTVVPAGAVDAMVRRLDERPDVAALGPRLVDGSALAELSYGRMYTPWSEAVRKAALALDARGFGPTRAAIERATRREQVVDWVSGACLLVRRDDGDAVGWFDERYFMYAEDVDFCAALRARGRRVLFSPGATVVHLRGRSGRTRPGPTRDAWRASHLAFYRKHHPRWAPLLGWYLRLTR